MTVGKMQIPYADDRPPCNGCGQPAPTILCFDNETDDGVEVALCDPCLGLLKGEICVGRIVPDVRGGGKVGRSHPEQSRRAAATVQAGTQQFWLLKVVRNNSPDGITSHAAAPKLSGWASASISANQTATRMGELVERGLVIAVRDDHDQPVLAETTPGNEGQLWKVTEAGLNELARLDRTR